MKDSKSGKRYVHNMCRPCRIEANYVSRLKRLAVDPKYDSVRSSAWNKANRERINKRRRENLAKKRGLRCLKGGQSILKSKGGGEMLHTIVSVLICIAILKYLWEG